MAHSGSPAYPALQSQRRRWWWLPACVVVLALLATAFAVIASAQHPSPWIGLTRGRYHGRAWELYAEDQNGQFCMQLATPGRPNGGRWTGACGFNRDYPDSYYFVSGLGPADSLVSFGPVPSNAVGVRIATHQVAPTRPLSGGLPTGRYWISFASQSGATPARDGRPVWPRPLDANGHRVAWADF